jgi:N,N'-diacetylchitobiose transport system substrate-binding protein
MTPASLDTGAVVVANAAMTGPRRHRWRALAVVVAAALAITGCGGGADEPRTLTAWIMDPGSPEAEEVVAQAVREIESRHRGLTVRLEYIPWTQGYDRFLAATSGGPAPDLAELSTGWTAEFAATGALAPITPRHDDIPALVAAGTLDGTSYGYPWYGGARALVYRTDLLERAGLAPPATWDELLVVGEQLARAHPDIAPIHVAGGYTHWYASLIWGAGGEIATAADGPDDGGAWRPGVDSPAGRAALAHVHRLWQAGWTPPAGVDWTSVEVRDEFAAGRSAMLIAGGWDLAHVLARQPDLADRVAVALLPAGPAGVRDAFAGGSHLAVFDGAAEPDLAHELAQLLTSPDRAASFTGPIGFLPGTAAGVQAAVGDDPLFGPFGTQLVEHSRSYPAAPWWSQVESERVFAEQTQRLLRGEQTVNETVSAIDTAISTAIDSAIRAPAG